MSNSLQHTRRSEWTFSSRNNSVAIYVTYSHSVNGINSEDLHIIERYSRHFSQSVIRGSMRQGETPLSIMLGVPILPHPVSLLHSFVDVVDENLQQVWSIIVGEVLALHKAGLCHGSLSTDCIFITKGVWDKILIEPPSSYPAGTSIQNEMRLSDLNFLLSSTYISDNDRQAIAEEKAKIWQPVVYSMVGEKGVDYVPYFRECTKILTTVICDVASSFSLEVLFVSIELLHRMRRLLPKDINDPFGNVVCAAVIGTAVSLSVKMSNRELPMPQIVREIIKVCRIQSQFDTNDIANMEIQALLHIKGQLPRNCVFHRCTTMSQCLSLYRDFIIKATETTNYFGIRLSNLCEQYTAKASGPPNLLTVRDMFS